MQRPPEVRNSAPLTPFLRTEEIQPTEAAAVSNDPETPQERQERLLRWALKAKASAANAPTDEARKNFLEIAAQWEEMAQAACGGTLG